MPHSVNNSTATMSRPSSASTNDANAFPKQAGAILLAPEPVREQFSPSRSTFSFDSSPKSAPGSEKGVAFDEARLNRAVSRGATGEKKGTNSVGQRQQNYRRRTQYFEQEFAYKEDTTSSARDRVTQDAPIIAELRTNVIIKDEYTLVTDLSHQLSTRYRRPEASIMITVSHSACLLLGGSFEPTYILTITALPVQVQPTVNKRNAALIQAFMTETLGVASDRGIIKFMAIQEDSIATKGMTILGEIEQMERQYAEENGSGLKRAMTKSSRRSVMSKSKSSIQLSRNNSRAAAGRVITPPLPSPGPFDSGVAVDQKGKDHSTIVDSNLNNTFVNRKPSKQLREKSGVKAVTMTLPPPPPIPEEAAAPRIGKRKSFIAIFRR